MPVAGRPAEKPEDTHVAIELATAFRLHGWPTTDRLVSMIVET
jgi:hypothetical protein